MALIIEALSWFFLVAGSLILVGTVVVVLRMRTFYTRLHAASVNETMGPGLILLGLGCQSGGDLEVIFKLALILVFLVLTGPVAAHALAKAALDNGILPGETQRLDEERSSSST